MSGFGRTGKWFGIDHYPFVKPDLLVMAKGLTSGYVPMGAVTMTSEIASHFDKNTLWAGLTYSSHALACATAIANIEVYRDENLIENTQQMGKILRAGLVDLAEKHESIGEVRGTGLLQVIELVKLPALWQRPSTGRNSSGCLPLQSAELPSVYTWSLDPLFPRPRKIWSSTFCSRPLAPWLSPRPSRPRRHPGRGWRARLRNK